MESGVSDNPTFRKSQAVVKAKTMFFVIGRLLPCFLVCTHRCARSSSRFIQAGFTVSSTARANLSPCVGICAGLGVARPTKLRTYVGKRAFSICFALRGGVAFATTGDTLRPKILGEGPAVPLDRNARARVDCLADAHHRAGRLSHTARLVLHHLVRTFQNRKTGRCFPTWETIAAAAGVSRASIGRALKALESLGLLTWVNRLTLERRFMKRTGASRWRAVPTSNAYVIHDPIGSKYHHDTQTRNRREGRGQAIGGRRNVMPLIDETLTRLATDFPAASAELTALVRSRC